ncbi:MAG: tetratricopeptide repeat protein [Planctomycetota bacterium]|nr:tetratricopeptide repeat protein [Planctomycetota bacterium]
MSDTLLRKTLAEDPLNTGVRLQLANLLTLAGRYREAEQILCEGITAGDAHRDLLMQHGESLLDTDQPELAVTRFREVLQLVPNNADALASLGGALLRIGAHAEAAAVLSRAANCLPHDAVVHELWGEALAAIDCRQEAARAFQHAWGLQRRTRAIAFFCGNVACDQGNFALAIEMFTAGTELPGDEPVPWHNLGKSCFEVGDVTAATLAFRQSLAIDRPIGMRNLALIIAGDPTATHTDVKNVRSEYAQMIAIPDNGWQPRVRNPRHPAGPLRIGYVSSFFAFPNYMKPVYAVLQAHDRSTVDIELFHDGPPSPELVACFENSAVSMVHEVSASSNTQLVDCIRSRNLDVLVDLNGYSAMQRLAIYTVRLASHVIGWFNHFGPASLPGIDCLVGDTQTMHEAEKPFYDEQLVQLPLSYLAFHVSHPAPDIVSPPCCTADHITFGSLCTQYKVTPDVLRGWARLLRDVPRSRLILANRTLESDDVATNVREYPPTVFRYEAARPTLTISRTTMTLISH